MNVQICKVHKHSFLKKALFYTITVAIMATSSSTFAQSFEKDMNMVYFGLGFPNVFKSEYDLYAFESGFSTSGFGPLYIKYEHAITNQLGIGANVSYLSYKNEWKYGNRFLEGFEGSLLTVLIRGNFHFATGNVLDPYIGVGLGYIGYYLDYYNTDPDFQGPVEKMDYGLPIGYSGSIGARYYVNDFLAAYAELGYDRQALMQIGISVRF